MLTLYGIMTTKTDSPHIAPISLRYRSDIGLLLVLYLRRGADERRRRLIGTDELERDAPEALWRRAGERADSGAQVSRYSHIGAISGLNSNIGAISVGPSPGLVGYIFLSDPYRAVTDIGAIEIRYRSNIGAISDGDRYQGNRGPILGQYGNFGGHDPI